MEERRKHIDHFYRLLAQVSDKIGGPIRLGEADGRMDWPQRGVYFFFEAGEVRENGSDLRVVRVGTHALRAGASSKLWGRLSQHRGTEAGGGNRAQSIFRDVIGDSLEQKKRLENRGCMDRTFSHRADKGDSEEHISSYIGQMPFVWIEVADEPGPDSLRGYIERNAIALLSNFGPDPIDPASPHWLGHHSSRERIQASGLWNSNHVTEEYNPEFIEVLEQQIAGRAMDETGKPEKPRHQVSSPAFVNIPALRTNNDFSVVIQCAKSKVSGGHLRDERGRPVLFVADPALAPLTEDLVFAHPDDIRWDGQRWRDYVLEYNAFRQHNPLGLNRAADLYTNPAYAALDASYGGSNFYILSAGWGLVPGNFLLPNYDITFSPSANVQPYQRRTRAKAFDDFRGLELGDSRDLIYVGGRGYISQFDELTRGYGGRKIVYYNSSEPPVVDGCALVRFNSDTRTNWHYRLAHELADRSLLFAMEHQPETNSALEKLGSAGRPSKTEAARSDNQTFSAQVSGKYEPLFKFLLTVSDQKEVTTLSFARIEELICASLPKSAYDHVAVWWSNGGHAQANAWMNAGFLKDSHHIGSSAKDSWIRFRRDR